MKLQLFSLLFLYLISIQAQVYSYETEQNGKLITHRITMDDSYLVETQYLATPAEFILTRGGFYTKTAKVISVDFEFNSNFDKDGLKQMELEWSEDWILLSKEPKDLNGKWLMAGMLIFGYFKVNLIASFVIIKIKKALVETCLLGNGAFLL